ncbi:unnamed protein product, partial [Staurois parvus]
QGSCSLIGQSGENENAFYKLKPVLCWTLSHKTALTADKEMYLAVYIY